MWPACALSDKKKMDSPEGVTILASAVFDDVLGIILLAVILGIVAVISGTGASISGLEIAKIAGKINRQGYTLVPLKLYFKGSLVKMEIALCQGKHTYDKKRSIMEKDLKREKEREIKNYPNLVVKSSFRIDELSKNYSDNAYLLLSGIERLLKNEGMESLLHDGLNKVNMGITSFEELKREININNANL